MDFVIFIVPDKTLFSQKNIDFSLNFPLKYILRYSLGRGATNEYPQYKFPRRNKGNIYLDTHDYLEL